MPTPRRKPPVRDPERHTLVKYLVAAGLGSRRHCAALVLAGYVTVNGETAGSLMGEVTYRDRIEVDGRPVQAKRGSHVYLAVNKPDGYLSAVSDDRERETVLELVPRALRVNGLVPAGRLDLHSTGLILLTNDGELVNRITHPRYEVEKEYHVSLDRVVQPSASSKLRTGVEIEGGTARAKALRRLQDEPGYRYSVVLNEGKKREVRLMFREVGRTVEELQRVRIGTLNLGSLAAGEARELTDREVSDLKRLVGIYAPREEQQPPAPRPTHGRPLATRPAPRPANGPTSATPSPDRPQPRSTDRRPSPAGKPRSASRPSSARTANGRPPAARPAPRPANGPASATPSTDRRSSSAGRPSSANRPSPRRSADGRPASGRPAPRPAHASFSGPRSADAPRPAAPSADRRPSPSSERTPSPAGRPPLMGKPSSPRPPRARPASGKATPRSAHASPSAKSSTERKPSPLAHQKPSTGRKPSSSAQGKPRPAKAGSAPFQSGRPDRKRRR